MLFIAFQCIHAVYAYCDSGNKEGIPDTRMIAGWRVWQANRLAKAAISYMG